MSSSTVPDGPNYRLSPSFLFAVLTISLVGECAIAALPLVRDGLPSAVILLPDGASDVTRRAADELQEYVRLISGAKLPIYVEETFSLPDLAWLNSGATVVAIGPTRLAKEKGIDPASLPPEGFSVETHGNVVCIVGREDAYDTVGVRSTGWLGYVWPERRWGTLFGVQWLLENHMGVRWLWPGESGQIVPKQRDVVLPDIKHQDAPKLQIRKIMPGLTSSANQDGSIALGESPDSMLARLADTIDWCQRLGMGQSIYIDQTHSYGDAFWDAYHEQHPEWFAMGTDGKRMIKTVADRVRLCLSNRELQAEVARLAIKKCKAHPDVFSMAIGLDDVSEGDVFCQCDECKAFGPTLSDQVVAYSSAIAEIVAREHPDRCVTQFAYADWQDSPVEARVHENVIIMYVGTYTHGYDYTPDRVLNHKLWDDWSKKVDGKMVWRPNLPETLGFPAVYIHKLAEDLRRFQPKMWGADLDCLDNNWAARGLDMYVMSKLMWDPDRDVEAIVDDYCQKGFGPAAGPIKAYFARLEKDSSEIADRAPTHGYNHFMPFVPSYYNDMKIDELQSLLDRAKRAASGDADVLERIEFLQAPLDWMRLSLPAWKVYAENGDKKQATELVKTMYAFLRAHKQSYAIHAARIESKIGWMWRNFLEGTNEKDWSQAN